MQSAKTIKRQAEVYPSGLLQGENRNQQGMAARKLEGELFPGRGKVGGGAHVNVEATLRS